MKDDDDDDDDGDEGKMEDLGKMNSVPCLRCDQQRYDVAISTRGSV